MKGLIWSGTLATGGRAAEEFTAEIIVDVDAGPIVIRVDGYNREVMSPHEIRGDYWLRAIVALCDART